MTEIPRPRELEPEAPGDAKAAAVRSVFDSASMRSAAISLKRIADALEKLNDAPVNEYGETFAQSVYGGIARGLRDGRP